MNTPDRTTRIGCAAGVTAAAFGLLADMALFPTSVVTDLELLGTSGVVLAGAVAIGWGASAAWSLVEELTARPAAWPETTPSMRCRAEEPDGLSWGPGLESPRMVLAGFEGQLLHRRLVLAAEAFIARDAEYGPRDGLIVTDGDAVFQAAVERLCVARENGPERWLIIVRDPAKAGDEFVATTGGTPTVTQPSVVAAVVTYTRGPRNWKITVDELHALDATYVAGCAWSAWELVARRRNLPTDGTTATATLDRDGFAWNVVLRAPTTDGEVEDALDALRELLGELRVVDVWVEGTLPAGDDAGIELPAAMALLGECARHQQGGSAPLEITWINTAGEHVATGYFSATEADVHIAHDGIDARFAGNDADALRGCGTAGGGAQTATELRDQS